MPNVFLTSSVGGFSDCRFFRLLFRGGLVVMAAMMLAAAGAVPAMVPVVRRPGIGRLGFRRSSGTLRCGLRRGSGLLRSRNNH
jgi:hypothetical protein